MQSDRYTKIVLTVIAVALCALTLTQMETPEVMAASGRPEAAAVEMKAEEPQAQEGSRFTITTVGPLRWWISYAAEYHPNQTGANECHTSVSLTGTGPGTVEVEVHFTGQDGTVLSARTGTVPHGGTLVFQTNSGEGSGSRIVNPDVYANTGMFKNGYARVYADDPRVMAVAFVDCMEDLADGGATALPIHGLLNIPAYPVGATADIFQAAMRPLSLPPMADSELPE